MTCSEFLRTVNTDPESAARAEISATILHYKACEDCRKILSERSAQYRQTASPLEVLLSQLEGEALGLKFRSADDPEAPA